MPESVTLSVLVIDDDPDIRRSVETYLNDRGHQVVLAATGEEGLDHLQKETVDIVITDVKMPGMDGFEVLREVRNLSPQIDVIMITEFQEIENAFRAMREGAFDFFTKPLKVQDLSASLQRTLRFQSLRREKEHVQQQLDNLQKEKPEGIETILGTSSATQTIKDQILQVSKTAQTSVLITGETGTGKELVARAIHAESERQASPFIPVNCSALPESLIESELFGHEKGAFTDAKETRKGHFEQANGGTLFLDEIGDMPLDMQTRLLRALEERTIRRLGGTGDIAVDVRIVSATNRNLTQAVADGAFREDLLYRLNTVTLTLPPLRERPDDFKLLAQHFVAQYAQETGKAISGLTPEAIAHLQTHAFTGNVRELRNVIERAVIFCNSSQLEPQDLQFHGSISPQSGDITDKESQSVDFADLPDLTLATFEKQLVTEALRRSSGNLSQAARLLGVSREVVRTRMKTHGLTPAE